MPLHKYPPKIWDALKMKQGIYARLPAHYLKSLEQGEPTPVHWRPLGVQYRASPMTGLKERVQDVPIPIYYPPESQDGLWGGEGWISGFKYSKNDKVSLLGTFLYLSGIANCFCITRTVWFLFCDVFDRLKVPIYMKVLHLVVIEA